MRQMLIAVLLLTATVGSAVGQSELSAHSFVPPKPGTVFWYDTDPTAPSHKRERHTVLADASPFQGTPTLRIQGPEFIMLYDRRSGNLIGPLNSDGSKSFDLSPNHGNYEWPLTVGKRWVSTYDYTDYSTNRTWHGVQTFWKVEAEEIVTVPAGTFKTLRLQSSPGEKNGTRRTRWYAPSIGAVVKNITERSANHYLGQSRTVSVLSSITVPGS